MAKENEAIKAYKVENRGALIKRVASGANVAIDTLVSAAKSGDIRASEIILRKVLPDLKAVDISHNTDGAKIVINQTVYMGGKAKGQKTVELPSVNINIREREKEYKEIDVTPDVKVSEPPPKAAQNYAEERKKGRFR